MASPLWEEAGVRPWSPLAPPFGEEVLMAMGPSPLQEGEGSWLHTHLFSLIGREKVDLTSPPWQEEEGRPK